MGILHTALATLKLATATPDAAEINNYVADTHKKATTEQVKLANEVITTNIRNKVLGITDGVKTRLIASQSKSREKLDTEPTPEEIKKANDVVAEITKLTDNDVINKYIKEHSSEWNETIINLMISKITEKENDYLNKSVQWADEESSIVGANPDMPEKSATIRKAKATREKHYFYAKTNTMRAIIAKLKSIIAKRTQQANLEKTLNNVEVSQTFDEVFAEILANPKFAGDIRRKTNPELAKELAKEVFTKFKPEIQEVFNSMHLRIEVKKYQNPAKIYVRVYYGTNAKGKEVYVKFLDSTKGSNTLSVSNNEEYGKTLISIYQNSDGYQELREKNGEIEDRTLLKNGAVNFSNKVQKFPNLVAVN